MKYHLIFVNHEKQLLENTELIIKILKGKIFFKASCKTACIKTGNKLLDLKNLTAIVGYFAKFEKYENLMMTMPAKISELLITQPREIAKDVLLCIFHNCVS